MGVVPSWVPFTGSPPTGPLPDPISSASRLNHAPCLPALHCPIPHIHLGSGPIPWSTPGVSGPCLSLYKPPTQPFQLKTGDLAAPPASRGLSLVPLPWVPWALPLETQPLSQPPPAWTPNCWNPKPLNSHSPRPIPRHLPCSDILLCKKSMFVALNWTTCPGEKRKTGESPISSSCRVSPFILSCRTF